LRRAKRSGRSRQKLYRLSWFANGDSLDVVVTANRLAAATHEVWRCRSTGGGVEAGDYFIRISPELANALGAAGVIAEVWNGARPRDCYRIKPAGVAVLAGKASAYPYYGYYAFALARLGYAFAPVDGSDIAAGALEAENIAVLPGGFANWGLDAKEESSGADAAFRKFLSSGGAAVGSCGGAYYLSSGRPAWLGVADARPVFTQEYLRTGVGIVTCQLAPGPYRLGLPPTLEIPYYHGPIYDEIGVDCMSLATFGELYGHGRLFIDNPLSEQTFAQCMAGRIAVLRASGARGEAVLFSPHPEMGDLLRKYMALETYIPHYLPIRGELVMRETLDSYSPAQSRSFLLVLNAVDDLLQGARVVSRHKQPPSVDDAGIAISRLVDAWRTRRVAFIATAGDIGDLERHLLANFGQRLNRIDHRLGELLTRVSQCRGDGPRIAASFAAIASHASASWSNPPQRRPAELLLELELALLLMEAWARLAEVHIIVTAHG
jgi:hypothetical protein